MDIVQITPQWFPQLGGAIYAIYELSLELRKFGVNTTIVTCKDNVINKGGFPIYCLKSIFSLPAASSPHPFVVGLLSLLKKLENKTDIFVGNSYIFEMVSRPSIFRLFNILKKPYVVFFRGGLDPALYNRLDLKMKIGKYVYDSTLGKLCFKGADHTVSVTNKDIQLIHQMFDIPLSKISYVGTAIHVEKFYHKEKKDKPLRVTFIGSLVKEKGVFFFEKIASSLPNDSEFIIVGDGPLKDYISRLLKRYSNVHLVGICSYRKIIEILSETDVLVHPSITEARSRVLMEAMASEVPPIAFDIGANNEIIKDNTGFLIKPFDIEDFCEKMTYLLNHDNVRKKMGKFARKWAESNFQWRNVCERIMKVFHQLIMK